MPSNPHVYVNTRQIKYGQYMTDKESGQRVWKPFEHTHAVDKEGNPLKMARVYLPSKEKREKVHPDNPLEFGVDKNGIDLDDRAAYIQIPAAELKKLKNPKANLRVWYFNNKELRCNVYFQAQKFEVDRDDPKWNRFDKPEVRNIGIEELQQSFPTTREEIKMISSQKKTTISKEDGQTIDTKTELKAQEMQKAEKEKPARKHSYER